MVTVLKWVLYVLLALIVLIAGGLFFISDPDIPREELVAKYGGPPSEFLPRANGGTIHVREWGPEGAPVLVLLHGSNASLHTWEPWAERLRDRFRVVAIDLPGHGLTGPTPEDDYSPAAMARFTLEALDILGYRTVALGGSSMGGAVAARVAVDAPERLSALILVAAGGLPPPEGYTPPAVFRLVRLPVVREIARFISPRANFEAGLQSAVVDRAVITDDMVTRYWELNRLDGQRAATLKRFATPWTEAVERLQSGLPGMDVPTLILWGRQDSFVPLSIGEAFDALIPNATLKVYDGVGHLPQEEIADATAADVRAFLDGVLTPQAALPDAAE